MCQRKIILDQLALGVIIKNFFRCYRHSGQKARVFVLQNVLTSSSTVWVESGKLPYFIVYNMHMSIVRIWISQWFLAKQLFLFFKNNFTRINHWKFIYHISHLKPFLNYLPSIVCRENFNIIFNVKKCTLYSIKYGTWVEHSKVVNPWPNSQTLDKSEKTWQDETL